MSTTSSWVSWSRYCRGLRYRCGRSRLSFRRADKWRALCCRARWWVSWSGCRRGLHYRCRKSHLRPEVNVVEGLIIDAESLTWVFKPMDGDIGECCVVRLNDGIRRLRTGSSWVCAVVSHCESVQGIARTLLRFRCFLRSYLFFLLWILQVLECSCECNYEQRNQGPGWGGWGQGWYEAHHDHMTVERWTLNVERLALSTCSNSSELSVNLSGYYDPLCFIILTSCRFFSMVLPFLISSTQFPSDSMAAVQVRNPGSGASVEPQTVHSLTQ